VETAPNKDREKDLHPSRISGYSLKPILNLLMGPKTFDELNETTQTGDLEAQFQLARLYAYGLRGVTQNQEAAASWYLKAAEQGHVDAQFMLGKRFCYGEGIGKDKGEALQWLSKAAANGHEVARQWLEKRTVEKHFEGEATFHQYFESMGTSRQSAINQEKAMAQQVKDINELYAQKKAAITVAPERLVSKLSAILLNESIPHDVVDARNGVIIVPANRKITSYLLQKVASAYEHIGIDPSPIRDKVRDVIMQFIGDTANELAALETERRQALEKLPAYKAIMELRQRAETGDVLAQYDLGASYHKGTSLIERDDGTAEYWLSAAAKHGHVPAILMLGDYWAAKQDITGAEKYYKQCVKHGSAEGLVRLGDLHADHWAASRYRDWFAGMNAFKESVRWYCKGAKKGHAQAKYKLAQLCCGFQEPADAQYKFSRLCAEFLRPICAYIGDGDSDRRRVIVSLYRAAAEQGHMQATKALGDLFAESGGADEEKIEAARWYQKFAEQCLKAADMGDAETQRSLGDCYEQGWIVSENPKENMASYRSRQAVKWYRKAAEQGDIEAQKKLGRCYAAGFGVAQNEVQAAKWYGRAGMQGDLEAYEELGDVFVELGDNRRAKRYYRKAGLKGWDLRRRGV
jgi:TPR repeat protein